MAQSTTIIQFPADQRPRERLLRHGPSALSDRELLAMVLRTGGRQRNAIDLAVDITTALGSLTKVSQADVDELRAVGGVGLAKATALSAAFELGRRVPEDQVPVVITNGEHLALAARPLLTGLVHERAVAVLVDSSLRLQRTIVLSDGLRDQALFSVRETLHAVLRSGAAGFGIAHNHPSGDLEASEEDRHITARLRMAAQTVDLRFLDHIVVSNDRWRSVR